MLHKEFWGILFLAFIAWVFVAGQPQDRINNFCKPISWVGSAMTSLSALVIPAQQENVKGWFGKFEYGCRYITWRMFYQDDYNAYMKSQAEKGVAPAKAASSADAPRAPTPPASAVAAS